MSRARATTLIAALLGFSLVLLAPPAPAADAASLGSEGQARVWSPDKKLGEDCHRQRYRYAVDVPSNDWVLELVLIAPNGDKVASGYQVAGGDPAKGVDHFDVCSPDLTRGRYTIRTVLRWYDADEHVRRLAPRRVTLR